MSQKKARERRREARERRERGVDARRASSEMIGVAEIECPTVGGNVVTVSVTKEQLVGLLADGIVWQGGDRYYADDRDLILAHCEAHPETMRCDFCARPEPMWDYPARDVATDLTNEGGNTWVNISRTGWAACARCSDRIEKDEWERLVDEVSQEFCAKQGVTDRDGRLLIGLAMANTFGAFRAARNGGRVLL